MSMTIQAGSPATKRAFVGGLVGGAITAGVVRFRLGGSAGAMAGGLAGGLAGGMLQQGAQSAITGAGVRPEWAIAISALGVMGASFAALALVGRQLPIAGRAAVVGVLAGAGTSGQLAKYGIL